MGTRRLLAGHSPGAFLRRFWQKAPLLVRGAIPAWPGLFTRDQLFALATRDDVEARLVIRDRGRVTLEHGPLRKAAFRSLPARNWTLLVQGVNLHADAADALLRRFAFIPYARCDDLMVSYAAPGGGVGPHIDSYDVFLLQGEGHRRWRYGFQRDLSLRPNLPLRILRRFTPQHDLILAAGDMLYLPPDLAHDGTAVDACMTYSIGFRAAAHDELAKAFLDFLHDELVLPGRYADPDLRPAREPARIAAAMQTRAIATLARIRWNRALAARFLGAYLSEPKANVFFAPPSPALGAAAFRARAARHGIALDRRTLWLYDDDALFINGQAHPWPAGDRALLARLANDRALRAADAARLSPPAFALVHAAYRDGYLHTG
jgi:50S ribosomal protein L16 3-hydroxylase